MIIKYLILFLIVLLIVILCCFVFNWIFYIIKKENFSKTAFNNNVNKIYEENNPIYDKKFIAYIELPEILDSSLLQKRFNFVGYKDCSLLKMKYGSETSIKNTCIGFLSCQKVCDQNAISVKNSKIFINSSCNGCGKCINVCPNNLIKIKPLENIYDENYLKKDFKFWKFCFNIFNKGS